MSKKKFSKLLVVVLALTMSVWSLAGCGGGASSDVEEPAGDAYQASEITSDAFFAPAVQAYYDKLDVDYAYKLTEELAYNWDDYAEACGWRTSGSDSEHKCSEYLESEMKAIGLQNVERVATDCDKFQFNSSSLKIDGSDVDFKGGDQEAVEAQTNGPASYQVNGTKGDLKAKIVNVEHGLAGDYETSGFKAGDIALAAVNQEGEAWINVVMEEAKAQGASALITYAEGGYGEAGPFTNNTQDVCCADLGMPSVSVSGTQAEQIKAAIEAGHDQATLNVDAVMEDDKGTTYNVCGMIPGKSHDQKIMVSGHYDKYWYGFQDDCAAMGVVFAVAKAMVESGYEPENDIYFVCHGAEEWGSSDSMYDWTTGAWGMCTEKDFADDVIAMINFELPAFEMDVPMAIASVPEFAKFSDKILREGIVVTEGDESIYYASPATTMEDGISYREFGAPYFLNSFEGTDFMCNNYHTIADNKDTYSESVFKTNLNFAGAYAIYVDNNPAIELDLTATTDTMKENFNADYAKEAGVDTDAYLEALGKLENEATALNENAAAINDKYREAMGNDDAEAAKAARAEGTELNKKALKAYQMIQDDWLKVTDFGCLYGHAEENDNVACLDGALACLESGEGLVWSENEDGLADCITGLNAGCEYYYCNYSKEVGDHEIAAHEQDYYANADQAMWGWNHMPAQTHTGKFSAMAYAVDAVSELTVGQVKDMTEGYTRARDEMIKCIGESCNTEIEQFSEIVGILQ